MAYRIEIDLSPARNGIGRPHLSILGPQDLSPVAVNEPPVDVFLLVSCDQRAEIPYRTAHPKGRLVHGNGDGVEERLFQVPVVFEDELPSVCTLEDVAHQLAVTAVRRHDDDRSEGVSTNELVERTETVDDVRVCRLGHGRDLHVEEYYVRLEAVRQLGGVARSLGALHGVPSIAQPCEVIGRVAVVVFHQ